MPIIRSRFCTPPDFLVRKLAPAEPMPESSHIRVWGMDTLPAGSSSDLHHHDCEEWWIIVSGRAEVETGGESGIVGQGDMVYTPMGENHRVTALEETTLVWLEGPLKTGGRSGHLQ